MASESLLKQEKSAKLLTGMLIGALLALLVIGIFLAFKNDQYTFIILSLTLLPIVLININNLNEVRKELDSRGKAL